MLTRMFSQYHAIFDILDRVLRSWWTIVAGVCLGGCAALAALHVSTPTYNATVSIYAGAERLPDDIVRTTIADDVSMRLPELELMAKRGERFVDAVAESEGTPGRAPSDEALRAARGSVRVSYKRGMVEVSASHTDRRTAALLANAVADGVVAANASFRVERAGQNVEELQTLVDARNEELINKKSEINRFRAQHSAQLLDQLESNRAGLRDLQERATEKRAELAQAEDKIAHFEELREQDRLLGTTLDVVADMSDDSGAPALGASAERTRVVELEREVARLLLDYEEAHPTIQSKRREIARLRDVIAQADAAAAMPDEPIPDPFLDPSGDAGAPTTSWYDAFITSHRSEMDRLRRELVPIDAEIRKYQATIARTPAIQQDYDQLTAGLRVIEDRYNRAKLALETARDSLRFEETQSGVYFEILDRARPPRVPSWPNPIFMLAVGVIGGIALFVGPIVARAFLRPAISSESSLRSSAPEVPVLVSIPTFDTAESSSTGRRRLIRNFGLSAIACAGLLVAVVLL